MSDYSNEWQVEIIFEPTGDYMNFTYETDEDEELNEEDELRHKLQAVGV